MRRDYFGTSRRSSENARCVVFGGGHPRICRAQLGVTALLAAENGYIDIVRSLLETDVNIDAKDEDGRSALRRAKDEGYSPIIEMIDDSSG